MKIKSVVCLVLCLCLLLAGCRSSGSGSSKINNPEEGVTVTAYYVNNPVSTRYRYIESMIKRYKRMTDMPDTIEETAFSSYEEMAKAIEEEGMPDLIIFDDWYGDAANAEAMNLSEMIAAGEIVALDDFLQQDEIYDADNYVGGAMEAGQVEGTQYVLPLSMKAEYLLTDESKINTTILSELSQNYTSNELIEVLLKDGEQNAERSLYWTIITTNQYGIYGIGITMSNLLQGAGYLQPSSQTVIPDKEGFKQAIEYLRLCMALYRDMYNGPDSSALGDVPLEDLPDVFLESIANMNLPFMMQYFQSVYNVIAGKNVVLHLYPYGDSVDTYGVTLNGFAVISEDSEVQEGAYRVARAFMDMEADAWANINEESAMGWATSVNLNVLRDQISAAESSGSAIYHWEGGTRFDKQQLTGDNAAQLKEWAEHIQYANLPNPEISTILEHYFGNYVYGLEDTIDWDSILESCEAAVAAVEK